MTDEQLKEMFEQQRMLIEKLGKPKQKDIWDILSILSTFLSSIVITVVGIYFTNAYKAQEVRISEAQTIEKFVGHLAGTNENAKKGAILAVATLSNKELAVRLGALYASSGTIEALELLLKNAEGEGKTLLRDSLIDAYFNRGRDSVDKNMNDQAVYDYSRIFALKSKNDLREKNNGNFLADCFLNRAIAYRNIGKLDLSIADSKESLNIIKDYGLAYWNLGNVYLDLGDLDKALSYYDLAVKNGPEAGAYLGRGEIHFKKGNFDQAIADYNQSISLKADDHYAYYDRAIAYERKGDLDNAESDFRKARELTTDPTRRQMVAKELEKISKQKKKR